MADHPAKPVRYDPLMEKPEPDEQETQRELNETFRDILETTSKDYGHAVRAVHAKAHGLLEAELVIRDDLPSDLAQGLFASPGRYPAVMRFSTNPGDILDDSISVPRGLAIKLHEVPGARLEGSENDRTQDFILVNGPAFAAPDAKRFLANLKVLAKTTNKAEGGKKILSAAMRGVDTVLSAVGIESAAVRTLGGAPNVHPLGESYYGQAAFRYGEHIAKFALVPVSSNLTEITGDLVDATDRPDALREVIAERMIEANAVWELRVQLCRDLEKMPIEDPSVPWDEEASPFETVAVLTAPAQPSYSHDRARAVDDGMKFSVWTGLDAHRPLGSVNRARKSAYAMSAEFRSRINGCPLHEPQQREPLPA